MGSNVIPFECLVKLHQLHVNFLKKNATYFEHLTSKQYTETDYLISEEFAFEVLF